jgi:uncharacterized BrkB/YihY/UPF0761 family membrane protein
MFLGLVLGVILVAPLFWTSHLFSSRNADVALYVVMGSVFGGLLVGLAFMTGYWFVSRNGFVWFGPAMVAGFVVALGVLAARLAMQMLSDDDTEG